MRFFAFVSISCLSLKVPIPQRHSQLVNMNRGKLVDKGWILALLLTASLALEACGGEPLETVDPATVIAAADSAERSLSGELSIKRDSLLRPSIYFDTLLLYYSAARMIEREKRLDADSLARIAVLAIDNIKDEGSRNVGAAALRAFASRDSVRAARRESLASSLANSLKTMLDSSAMDAEDRTAMIAEVTSRKRFEPGWRTRLDQLTLATVKTELDILRLLDTAGRRVQIEESIQFLHPADLANYQSLTSRLGQLAAEQQSLVDAVTYGADPKLPAQTQDTLASAPAAPKVSWPEAVRVR